jgi:diaminopimelate decarboxylase
MNIIAPRFLDALRATPRSFDTPCFLYDPLRAADNYRELRSLLGTRLIVSVKANHNMDVNLRIIHPGIDGFELASSGELTMMPKTSGAPVFLNNPAMDTGFMRSGLAVGATFIIDRPSQLKTLLEASAQRTPQPLVLRVNASVLHQFVKDAPPLDRPDHFGMDLPNLMAAVDFIRDNGPKLQLRGLHCFAGSHSFMRLWPFHAGFARQLQQQVEARYGQPLAMLNLGGGFPGDWRERSDTLREYAKTLSDFGPTELYHEAGRAIYEDSGIFVTKVLDTKTLNGVCIAVCDGGIAQNFLLAQTERQIKKRQSPAFLRETRDAPASSTEIRYVGASCNRDDVIGQAPVGSVQPEAGDLILFDRCGAYNDTYSVGKFLALKEAKSYVIA